MAELGSSARQSGASAYTKGQQAAAHVPRLFLYDLQTKKDFFFFIFKWLCCFSVVIVTNLPKT